MLLDKGANIDAAAKDGETALHYPAQRGDHDTALVLFGRGANIDSAAKDGKSALLCPVGLGHLPPSCYCLAERQHRRCCQRQPDSIALFGGAGSYFDRPFIDRDTNIDAAAKHGKTALHVR